ncbi:uncharacterized protein LOC120343499 [Styela clava]
MQRYPHTYSRRDPRRPKSSFLALNLSESLFTVDTVIGSVQSKSTYISEDYGDNVSSDIDAGSARLAFKRKDENRESGPSSPTGSPQQRECESEVSAGRSLIEPSVDWTVFKSADANLTFVTKTWRQLHPQKSYISLSIKR